MPQVRQRDALGVLTKPRLLEIADALGLGLPGRLLKPELVNAIAASTRDPARTGIAMPAHPAESRGTLIGVPPEYSVRP